MTPEKTLRILHILDHSLPLQSGYVFRTLSILREQRRLGWETVHVTTPRHGYDGASVQQVDGWEFHRTPASVSGLPGLPGSSYVREMVATQRRVDELVRQFRPDIVHAHSPVLNALPALWTTRRHGVPLVYEVRALWEDGAVDHGTTQEGSVRYRLSRALETFAMRRADHVTTICEGLRNDIAARGIASDRVTVIPNAVDPRSFAFDEAPDAALREKLGLQGTTILGFAGSFYGYEGLDVLIGALAQLASRRSDLRVLLVGGGPQEQALKDLAERLGVASRVVFSGRVPHDQVAKYYSLMDVLVYPRHRMRVTELVTPLKPLEAMAQGRVLVASDVGGHRELVRDGETGFLFRAGDAGALAARIDDLLDHREAWAPIKERARRFVERERTWARSVGRYSAVYDGLLSKRRAVAGQSTGNA